MAIADSNKKWKKKQNQLHLNDRHKGKPFWFRYNSLQPLQFNTLARGMEEKVHLLHESETTANNKSFTQNQPNQTKSPDIIRVQSCSTLRKMWSRFAVEWKNDNLFRTIRRIITILFSRWTLFHRDFNNYRIRCIQMIG